ncbi:LacI family DNA-binding transcriptional regulator [Sphingomonas crusticola]|uniref:LacI family DNA-binding transcriptional regulator n=1 Tax=Sphingomonas crusticola TaxID=1697973 RepID=UPI001F07868A|nr:LacI family DNA-binding transcriptional regulator [Sphingomonas crusticola]
MNEMTPPRPPATISDVAEAAGVSIKTVSRVFNEEPNVREETRRHVLQIVAELDYHPNMAARSLAGRKSYLIGLLYDNPCANYILGLQSGSLDRLRGDKWRLLVVPCEDSGRLGGKTVSMVRSAGVGGVILTSPICDNPEILNELITARIPLVRIAPAGDANIDAIAPSVGMDDCSAAADITQHLIALGHRRIAIILGDPTHSSNQERWAGFNRAMDLAGLQVEPSLVGRGLYTFESGLEAARLLLNRPDRPTAIFAQNDDMAAGAIVAAGELGIAVPTQLSVVGFDDSQIASTVWPRITTIRQPIRAMAQAATDALVKILEGSHRAPEHRLMPYELIVRESCGPVPAE